jgi:diguanylate cyclase (GGDEF)-like protein
MISDRTKKPVIERRRSDRKNERAFSTQITQMIGSKRLAGIYVGLIALSLSAFMGVLLLIASLDFFKAQRHFNALASQIHQDIRQQISVSTSVLDGFSAFLGESGAYSLKASRSYASTMLQHYPQLYMLQVAQKVQGKNVKAFEASYLNKLGQVLSVRRYDPKLFQMVQAGEPSTQYLPIVFMEPLPEESVDVLGVDLYSFDFLKQAVDQVQLTGEISISKAFELYEESVAFTIIRPVDGRADLFALVVLRAAALVPEALLEHEQLSFTLELDGEMLYKHGNAHQMMWWLPEFTTELAVPLGQGSVIMSVKQYLDLDRLSIGLMLGVLAFALVLSWSVWSLYRVQVQQQLHEAFKNQRLYRLANYDELTGLANRAHFMDHADHAFMSAQRRGSKVGLLYLDLNDFKQINDTYGHQMGDTVLMMVSGILLDSIRADDLAARIGGDEFVILLENIHDVSDSQKCVDRINEKLHAIHEINNMPIVIRSSIGFSAYPDDGKHLDQLIEEADKRMYIAKKNSRRGHQSQPKQAAS